MAKRFDYDVAVIGGGSAGYAAARTAAAAGLRVAVIESAGEVGGLCILRGCMPTKLLLYAAEVMHLVRQAGIWGIHLENPSCDFAEIMERKRKLIAEFAAERREQLASGAFDFIRARAEFRDPHTLALSDRRPLTAAHFVIATGSKTAAPPIESLLRETGYLTSDDALELTRLPASLAVLGGGPVAVEFAQFFARLGVRTSLIQRSDHILRGFDTDAAMVLENVFRREGIDVRTGTKLTGARRDDRGKTIEFLHRGRPAPVTAEEILFALGRVPDTAALQLGHAGVATEDGRIVTNAIMQTSAPHIYAAGDCAGPHEIVHIAIQQGETAARHIARPADTEPLDDRLLIRVVFTEPQLASAGLSEKEAMARGTPFLTARHAFADHGKSLIMEATDGFVKLLADPQSGEILGGTCVGPLGGELIHEIVAAMAKRMTVHELAALPHYHPTLAEIWSYPASELAENIPVRRTSG